MQLCPDALGGRVDDDLTRGDILQWCRRIPSFHCDHDDDAQPRGRLQRAVGGLRAGEEVATDHAEEGHGRADRCGHDDADDTFHGHRAKDEDDRTDEGHRRGDGLTEGAARPAQNHAAAHARREGQAGEDCQAEVSAGLLQSQRKLPELYQILASPGQRPAGEGPEDEGNDKAAGDGHRRSGILFLLIAGGGEPERQARAEERDVDE